MPGSGVWTERRGELVIDLDAGTVSVGDLDLSLAQPAQPSDLLAGYLRLVYEVRSIAPGTPVPIRDVDLEQLADVLDWRAEEIERDLMEAMRDRAADPDIVHARSRRVLLALAGGSLVAALGLSVLVSSARGGDADGPREPTIAPEVTDPPAAPAGVDLGPPPIKLERDADGTIREVRPGE